MKRFSQPQKFLGIAAANGGRRRRVKAGLNYVTNQIVVRHVERVVRAHDDFVDAEDADEFRQLMRREHDGVEVDALQIRGRRVRQLAMR